MYIKNDKVLPGGRCGLGAEDDGSGKRRFPTYLSGAEEFPYAQGLHWCKVLPGVNFGADNRR